MEISSETIEIKTVGVDAAAIGSGKTPAMMGFLLDIELDFHASAPATTDVTITDENGNAILTVTDSNTDAVIAPRQKLVDNANAAITNSFERFPLNGQLSFAVAGCNALDPALTAKVRYLRL